MAAANLAATVFVAVAFIGVGFRTPWRVAAEALGVAFLFSVSIGTLCAVVHSTHQPAAVAAPVPAQLADAASAACSGLPWPAAR